MCSSDLASKINSYKTWCLGVIVFKCSACLDLPIKERVLERRQIWHMAPKRLNSDTIYTLQRQPSLSGAVFFYFFGEQLCYLSLTQPQPPYTQPHKN